MIYDQANAKVPGQSGLVGPSMLRDVERPMGAMESAMNALELEQKRLYEYIGCLNDKLTPILMSQPESSAKGEARPRHSAPLVEAINTQAEMLRRATDLLQEITGRVAL
jgi:hypothetical protein